MANTSGLIPFEAGSERAREAGRKGGQARAARQALSVERVDQAATELRRASDTFKRADIGPGAVAVAGMLLAKVLRGEIVVKRGDEAAALLRAVVDVARLEAGDHTSASVVAHLSTSEAVARIMALADQVDEGRGLTTALAVVDADVVEVPSPLGVVDGVAVESGGVGPAKPNGAG